MIRRGLHLLIGLAIALVMIEGWFVRGVVAPLELTSGSMAPTWNGPHYADSCRDCYAVVNVDALLERPASVICPMCGSEIDLTYARRWRGDQLRVDRISGDLRDFARWDAVVLRPPSDVRQQAVKRIVGLPSEVVSIVDGDVLVDGQRARKDWPVQRELRQPLGLRWDSPLPSPDDRIRWERTAVHAVTDESPYNAGRSQALHAVYDWMLEVECRTLVADSLRCELGDDVELLRFEFNEQGAFQFVLVRQDWTSMLATGNDATAWRRLERGGRLVLANFDRQGLVVVDDRVLAQVDLPAPIERRGEPVRPKVVMKVPRRGCDFRISMFRDLYYDGPPGRTWRLGAGEYFVVGDNPSVSQDSRWWPDAAVPRRLILGRPVWRSAKVPALGPGG